MTFLFLSLIIPPCPPPFVFGAELLHVPLTGLELAVYSRLVLNSQRSTCPFLLSLHHSVLSCIFSDLATLADVVSSGLVSFQLCLPALYWSVLDSSITECTAGSFREAQWGDLVAWTSSFLFLFLETGFLCVALAVLVKERIKEVKISQGSGLKETNSPGKG